MYRVEISNGNPLNLFYQIFDTKGQVMSFINALLEGCKTVNITVVKCEVDDGF